MYHQDYNNNNNIQPQQQQQQQQQNQNQYQDLLTSPYYHKLATIAQSNNTRLLCDLEFLDLISDPEYVCRTLVDYVNKETFVNYVMYLNYLRHPDYIHLVQYHHSLYILSLLQNEHFRNSIGPKSPVEQRMEICRDLIEQIALFLHSTTRSPDELLQRYQAAQKRSDEDGTKNQK